MKYDDMYKQADKEGAFDELIPQFFEFKQPGDRVVGCYKGSAPVEEDDGKEKYRQYFFLTDHGLVKFHLGKVTDREVLSQLEKERVYAVIYQGQAEIGHGKRVNKFLVRRLKA